MLGHPGFRVTEQAWRTITTLRHLANRGHLIIETLDPDNPRLRRLLQPAAEFLAEELRIRKETRYPPYGELITITVADPSETAGLTELEGLRARLRSLAGDSGASVSRPLRPSQPFRHGKWRWTIAVRHAESSEPLLTALERLPEQFLIERDPDSIT
jgi:primosomal protein N'